MNPFRVCIFWMVPLLLLAAAPTPTVAGTPSCKKDTRRLLLTSSHREWQEELPRRLSEESKGEHGGSSERKLIVPKGALYNMYFSIAKKDPAEDAYPHIWALFEPVNKTYDYFTFASCFTNTSSWGELIPLSDDPELNELLFVDPAATPPTLDYRQLVLTLTVAASILSRQPR